MTGASAGRMTRPTDTSPSATPQWCPMIDFHEQAPNNLTPYNQGRADHRRRDWVVGIACLFAVAIFVVWGE